MKRELVLEMLSFIRRYNQRLFQQIVCGADSISNGDPEKWSKNVASGLMMHAFHENRGSPEPTILSLTSGTGMPSKEILSFLWNHNECLYRVITEEAEERSIRGPCSRESVIESELKKLGWHSDIESLEVLEALEALETE
jgi:hypothetical protein